MDLFNNKPLLKKHSIVVSPCHSCHFFMNMTLGMVWVWKCYQLVHMSCHVIVNTVDLTIQDIVRMLVNVRNCTFKRSAHHLKNKIIPNGIQSQIITFPFNNDILMRIALMQDHFPHRCCQTTKITGLLIYSTHRHHPTPMISFVLHEVRVSNRFIMISA
jgi:hypothetical protein